jgi:hypothetical protein
MTAVDLGTKDVAVQPVSAGYQLAKCTFLKNGVLAGYLASSKNAYVYLTSDPKQAAGVKWMHDKSGRWWLEKDTKPDDRFLGVGANSYADWGLWQAEPNGWIEPVIYNANHTIALAKDPSQLLYGPYGDDWVCWGSNSDNVLVVNFVDPPPPPH